ncbi:MAG: stage V sporulation protein AB [Lachnospiraceae bacterium]|nr:stage V sporulation protein AB [Lachnospiraceae bacterium]MCI9151468.1 stage V sporulation protein AB [Lachnospiraceae bacterium]
MWIKEVFLGFIGLTSGLAVSAAVFAFVITVGIVPRFAGKTHTSRYVLVYEHAILLGGILGVLLSVFSLEIPLGTGFLCLFGLAAGVYTGCLAVALAEILNAFPIMFRRLKLKLGLEWALFAMALGKLVGTLYFYANHMQMTG